MLVHQTVQEETETKLRDGCEVEMSVCERESEVAEAKHFESMKRWGERGMQTGHAMTKEERMFRATENSSERSRRENRRRKQEL